jgi:phosphoglycerol geranylgeranyltransferase
MTIAVVKKSIGIPVIVGGGITSPEAAREVVRAGADIVVTGTVAEFSEGRGELLAAIVAAVRKG